MVSWSQLSKDRVKSGKLGKFDCYVIDTKDMIVFPSYYIMEQYGLKNLMVSESGGFGTKVSDSKFSELMEDVVESSNLLQGYFLMSELPYILMFSLEDKKWYGFGKIESRHNRIKEIPFGIPKLDKPVVLRYNDKMSAFLDPGSRYDLIDGNLVFHHSKLDITQTRYHAENLRLLRRYPVLILDYNLA